MTVASTAASVLSIRTRSRRTGSNFVELGNNLIVRERIETLVRYEYVQLQKHEPPTLKVFHGARWPCIRSSSKQRGRRHQMALSRWRFWLVSKKGGILLIFGEARGFYDLILALYKFLFTLHYKSTTKDLLFFQKLVLLQSKSCRLKKEQTMNM